MLPILYGVGDSLGPVLLERFGFGWPSALGYDTYQVAFVFCCLGLAVGVYGSFVFDVITTICDYLDIWCLTIKHPWKGDENSNGSAQIKGKKAQ
jgi:ethanolaminephosphotransferase